MYYKNYLRNRQLENGFTLLEVIVAVSVITIGTMGVFTVISNTLSANKVNAPRLTAAYLAQEGLEIVRNIRDGNWLEGRTTATNWDEGLTGCALGCGVDYNHSDGYSDPNQEDPNLHDNYNDYLYINGDGFYSYFGTTKTNFQRKITITPEPPDVLDVQVLVTWTVGSNSYNLSAQEKLYNWR